MKTRHHVLLATPLALGAMTAALLLPGPTATEVNANTVAMFNGPCCLPEGFCISVKTIDDCFALGGTLGALENIPCEEVDCPITLSCRVTGGGVDTSGNWDGSMGDGGDDNRYTFGGQAGAPSGIQPQPYGEWTHHQQRGPNGKFVFHAGTSSAPEGTEIDRITCSDPGWCSPARQAPSKQIDFEGTGTFRSIGNNNDSLGGAVAGETYHWFEVHIEDLGEPGKGGKVDPPADICPPGGSAGALADCDCPDYYSITIYAAYDPSSEGPNMSGVIYHVAGYIKGGNLQIHPGLD